MNGDVFTVQVNSFLSFHVHNLSSIFLPLTEMGFQDVQQHD